jgi:signal transduction histidine kinase
MRWRHWLQYIKADLTGGLATTVAIAALAIAGPTAGLLYFMHRSLQGERQTLLAERNTARRALLQQARDEVVAQLGRLAVSPLTPDEMQLPPGRKFRALIDHQRADSCIILTMDGRVAFPVLATPRALSGTAPGMDRDADQLLRDFHQPAKNFSDGWQQLMDRFRGRQLWEAASPSGRLYAPSLQRAALTEMNEIEMRAKRLVNEIRDRLLDYSDLNLPSSQRLYLWHRHRGQMRGMPEMLFTAERLALTAADRFVKQDRMGEFQPTRSDANLLQVQTNVASLVLVFEKEALRRSLERTASAILAPHSLQAELLTAAQPVMEDPDGLLAEARLAVGRALTGWQLVAHDEMGFALIDAQVRRRTWQYSAIAVGGGLLLNVLAALAIRRFARTANLTQARQDFLSTLSHELRTPLTSIRMFVDTLAAGGLEDPARARTYLDFIRRENERLTRLAENFLTFTRLESQRMNFDLQEIQPEEVAESARVAVETRFAVEGTDFQVSVERKLPPILADHTLFTTAVVNLLENAFKYTPPTNKKILLSVARGHQTVRFTVADNGQGLTTEEMKFIGEKFYRPDKSARSGQPGFGLGLNIVSHIMRAHNGRLEIHTEPGVGSRFTLILPAIQVED